MTDEKKLEDSLSQEDAHRLEIAKLKKVLAQTNLEKAQAQSEAINMYFENILMSLSVKYSLTDKDSIDEKGKIVRDKK